MFKITNLITKEILPITCGTKELAQAVADLWAYREKQIYIVHQIV